MSEALASMADAYAAGVASDAGVVAFADLCTKKSSSRKALLPRITPLIVSEADLKQVHGNPHEKLRQLQLQVLCRLGQAALRKADPMDKTEKKVLYSILSSMAMKMDSMAMVASNNADDDTKSAFRTFILDTLAHRFQSSLPKTFKWLYRALEITLPNDDKTKKTTPSIVRSRVVHWPFITSPGVGGRTNTAK
ncbi:hypothetical protein DYB32_003616 [Aphanomyces invadans]|uniref:Uncharacterized protein n=1 Tax=Aphanomyces invadans TaxID=157072 RepID=A0A418B056_9STRA|nr:hypothetical protein DYB32_003616 [Aphanomyces invadans]